MIQERMIQVRMVLIQVRMIQERMIQVRMVLIHGGMIRTMKCQVMIQVTVSQGKVSNVKFPGTGSLVGRFLGLTLAGRRQNCQTELENCQYVTAVSQSWIFQLEKR